MQLAQRFLLIEDDSETAKIILQALSGLKGDWEVDGLKGYHNLLSHNYDLVILDIHLPSLNGLDLLRRVRNLKLEIPIMLLTGMSRIEERAEGLLSGADDYLCKPFSIGELQIRVKNLMKSQERLSLVSFGDLKLDRIKRTLTRGHHRIEVQEREFSLLDLLMSNPDQAISKSQILSQICGYNFMPNTNIVDVLVCRLRDKIADDKSPVSIRTIRGVGYKIHMEEKYYSKTQVASESIHQN